MTFLYSYKKDLNTGGTIMEFDIYGLANLSPALKERLNASSKLFVLTYNSPYITGVDENDRVHSEIFLNNIESKTLIVLLHGFASNPSSLGNYYGFIAASLENGYNCAFLNLPYHIKRSPSHEKSGWRLIYFDDFQTLEFYHQAVVDTRKLVDIVLGDIGINKIMLCGFSLGSMVSAITAAVDKRISKSALIFGGGNWHEIHWNSMLSLVLRGNCIEEGIITKKKCADIYRNFPAFMECFKSADTGSISLDGDFSSIPGSSVTKKCFLCDPLAFAHKLDPSRIIMFGSRFDHYFPKKSLQQFHKEAGMPQIKWFTKLHTSAILLDRNAKKLIFEFYQR